MIEWVTVAMAAAAAGGGREAGQARPRGTAVVGE